MPRIKKEDRTKFPWIVKELQDKNSDFTLNQIESWSNFALGSAVKHSNMPGVGFVVGYWRYSTIGVTIAYFPENPKFIGGARVPGCYSTDNFTEA